MTKILSHVHVVPTPKLVGISVFEVVDTYVYLPRTNCQIKLTNINFLIYYY